MECTPTSLLVDCYKANAKEVNFVKKLKELIADHQNCKVVYLSPRETELKDSENAPGVEFPVGEFIIHQDKLSAFYSAKRALDLGGVIDIRIVCLYEDINYWDVTCELLLTPVHKWKIESLDGQCTSAKLEGNLSISSNTDQLRESVLCKAMEIVHNIPSDGEIKTFHSSLIPDDIFYHGFTSRLGGISYIPGMKSLNLVYTNAKADPRIVINENRSRLAKYAGFNEEMFHTAHTVHGKDVHLIGNQIQDGGHDGVITNQSNFTIGAPGADCITIVFADPVQRACGAAHAGWKGTLEGVATEVIRAMESNFNSRAEDILVAMGPSIGKCCFEFGEKESKFFSDIEPSCVIRDFSDIEPSSVVRQKGISKPFINLQKVNRILLERIGVKPEHIDDTSVTMCTSCNPELFFSYRRDGRPFGNQIGFIGIK